MKSLTELRAEAGALAEAHEDPNPEGFYSTFAANAIKRRSYLAGYEAALKHVEERDAKLAVAQDQFARLKKLVEDQPALFKKATNIIAVLEARLGVAVEALDFYASGRTDASRVNGRLINGCTARETLARIKGSRDANIL